MVFSLITEGLDIPKHDGSCINGNGQL